MRTFGPALAILALLLAASPTLVQGQTAAVGFNKVLPSLVHIWVYDASGKPTASGSGFVVASDATSTSILTATHVIDGASKITVDAGTSVHAAPATEVGRTKRDVALIRINQGGLQPVTFRALSQPAVEGSKIAVAGYVKSDVSVQVGTATLRYPGTVAVTSDDDQILGLTNVSLEAGLSGSPVFDPVTGEVVGIVNTQSISALTGGYAVNAQTVLVAFLQQQNVVANVTPGKGKAPAKTDATLADSGLLVPGAQQKVTVIAVPFQEPGAVDPQLTYASGLLVKALRAKGYDVLALPPIDHVFAVARAAEFCRNTGAKGMFVGSFTYESNSKNNLLNIATDNMSQLVLGNNTDSDMHLDFVGCNKRPLWQTHKFRNANTKGVNQSGGTTATVEKTINDAVDEYVSWLKNPNSTSGTVAVGTK